LNSLW